MSGISGLRLLQYQDAMSSPGSLKLMGSGLNRELFFTFPAYLSLAEDSDAARWKDVRHAL